MKGVKITIECEDTLLTAVIAGAITEGLSKCDITNVQVKTLMVYSEAFVQNDPRPRDTFDKKSVINSAIEPETVKELDRPTRPRLILPELIPGDITLSGHPWCCEALREQRPELLKSPVLIDMGLKPDDYAKREAAFLNKG
jgi:hypothetical protein